MIVLGIATSVIYLHLFFNYKEIENISVFLDGQDYNRIPTGGYYGAKLFYENTIKRKWFLTCKNYFDIINVENDAFFCVL